MWLSMYVFKFRNNSATHGPISTNLRMENYTLKVIDENLYIQSSNLEEIITVYISDEHSAARIHFKMSRGVIQKKHF